MKPNAKWLVILAALLSLAANDRRDRTPKAESLQGTWIVKSSEVKVKLTASLSACE